MTSIRRTYPQPDSPLEHLGPRERALATFRYLLGLEPEEAAKHPLFAMMQNAFENSRRQGRGDVTEAAIELAFESGHAGPDCTLLDSLVEQVESAPVQVRVDPFMQRPGCQCEDRS